MRHDKIPWLLTPWRLAGALLLSLVGIAGFLCPGDAVLRAVFDPALNSPGVPQLARELHESLSPRYALWATRYARSHRAAELTLDNISGTEWPLYGSVFYLRAEETIQTAWEHGHGLFTREPRLFARQAIDAAARLVADPTQAAWVKMMWGEHYLEKENVFYRMLLISALASHRHLTGSDEFTPLLRQQTDSLAAELTASPTGLLDDYPGQCYPTDVVSAWEAIHQADAVLGTDHSVQIAAAVRSFTGERLGRLGLPAFSSQAQTAIPADSSRGCSNSNACMLVPHLWPDVARKWYASYEAHFWQHDWLAAGFRELPRGAGSRDWFFDVDAGPVLRGNGFAACAFGVAAARTNGRFDHAYPVSLEMVALGWVFPGGRWLLPELVSDTADAPLLGEAGILFCLVQAPVGDTSPRFHVGSVPLIVWLCLALQLGVGGFLCYRAFRLIRPRRPPEEIPGKPRDG